MYQLSCFLSPYIIRDRLFELSSDWLYDERPESEGRVCVVVRSEEGDYPHFEILIRGKDLDEGYIGPNLPCEIFDELEWYDMVVIRDIGNMSYINTFRLLNYLLSTKRNTKVYCQCNEGYNRVAKKYCKLVTPLGEELRLMGEMMDQAHEIVRRKLAQEMRSFRRRMAKMMNKRTTKYEKEKQEFLEYVQGHPEEYFADLPWERNLEVHPEED